MKNLLTVASISLLACLAFTPAQEANAQSRSNDGTVLDQSPNSADPDREGNQPGVDAYDVEGYRNDGNQMNNRDTNIRPNIDANRTTNESDTLLDQSPNSADPNREGNQPGVDAYDVEGYRNDNNIRRDIDANRTTNESDTLLDQSPNSADTDREGNQPGVDAYDIRGYETETQINRQETTRDSINQNPSVDRPRYNRPVTGQGIQQQPNQQNQQNFQQRPSSQQNFEQQDQQPVRGLW